MSNEFPADTLLFAAICSVGLFLVECLFELLILQVIQQQRSRGHVCVGPFRPRYKATLPAVLQDLRA
ncbi:MAG: hypothetical protein ACK58J_15155 [Planctomyces sp.]